MTHTYAEIRGKIHQFHSVRKNADAIALRLFVHAVNHALDHGNTTLVQLLHDGAKKTHKEAFQDAAKAMGWNIKPGKVIGLKRGMDLGGEWRLVEALASTGEKITGDHFIRMFQMERATVKAEKVEKAKAEKEAKEARLAELEVKVEAMGGNISPAESLIESFKAMGVEDQVRVLVQLQEIHRAVAEAVAA